MQPQLFNDVSSSLSPSQISLNPSIVYTRDRSGRKIYSGYVPYIPTEELRMNAGSPEHLSTYLGYSGDYPISFSFSYTGGSHEIGFNACGDLTKVFRTIRLLQSLLESRGAKVDFESEIPIQACFWLE
jgi:predicted heme/steroid binding protein